MAARECGMISFLTMPHTELSCAPLRGTCAQMASACDHMCIQHINESNHEFKLRAHA